MPWTTPLQPTGRLAIDTRRDDNFPGPGKVVSNYSATLSLDPDFQTYSDGYFSTRRLLSLLSSPAGPRPGDQVRQPCDRRAAQDLRLNVADIASFSKGSGISAPVTVLLIAIS
jgi:hypothetical protein